MSTNDGELLALIHSGRKLDAIKRLRETRGLGLSEAKAEVERLSGLSTAMRPTPSPPHSQRVDHEVRQLAQSGQRIAAIKLLRERNRLGLKQAKELLDATVPPPPGKAVPWLAIVLVVAAALVAAWLMRD